MPNLQKHHRLWLGILAMLIAFALIVTLLTRSAKAPAPTVSLKDHTVTVSIADTPTTRAQGLSGTSELATDHGMLFVFQSPEAACFWMKDMRYNLDILWFSANHRLIKVEKNLAPSTYPHSYCPDSPASHVLELKAGTADVLGVKVGDTITLPKQ